jgi:hypothetical protein
MTLLKELSYITRSETTLVETDKADDFGLKIAHYLVRELIEEHSNTGDGDVEQFIRDNIEQKTELFLRLLEDEITNALPEAMSYNLAQTDNSMFNYPR